MANKEREAAVRQFLSQVEEFSAKPEVHLTKRGKSVEEYFDIVEGLFEAYDKARGNRVEQDRLHTLSSTVMAIGEDVLGIDWS